MIWPVPGCPWILVLAPLSQTEEVILSQLCSKAKTGQSSKALGKESTESSDNRAGHTISLSLFRFHSLARQLSSAYLMLFSGPLKKHVPFPQLPAMPLWGAAGGQSTKRFNRIHFTLRQTLWNVHHVAGLQQTWPLWPLLFNSPQYNME